MSKRDRTRNAEERQRDRGELKMFLEHARLVEQLRRRQLTFDTWSARCDDILLRYRGEEVARVHSLDELHGLLRGQDATRAVDRIVKKHEAAAGLPLGRFADMRELQSLQSVLVGKEHSSSLPAMGILKMVVGAIGENAPDGLGEASVAELKSVAAINAEQSEAIEAALAEKFDEVVASAVLALIDGAEAAVSQEQASRDEAWAAVHSTLAADGPSSADRASLKAE